MNLRCAAIVLVLLVTASVARTQEYRWPLTAARKVSSSFGEFREGHYHAGIDLRTFGLIGLPCLAIDECDVVRLRVSPKGYGKAAYFRLRDGKLAVYAHLNGFSRELDSLSYYWRLEHGRSSFDLEIAPGTFRFRPGDTVSFTGATGSPQPHLHFEMRNHTGMPFNPLESMYRVPDACPPVISALEVVPLSWGSLVNGSPVACSRHLRLVKGGRYILSDTLQLDGTFGFGVSAYDKQARGSYRMAPYSIELVIDGQRIYRLRNSRFDYSQVGDISLEYEERGGDAPGRYLLLFAKPANNLPDRDGIGVVTIDSSRTDALGLTSGIHRGEIIIRDANGNEARAVFHFAIHRYPIVEISRSGADSSRIGVASFDPDGGSVSTALFASLDAGKTWNSIALTPSSDRLEGKTVSRAAALYRCVVRDDEGAKVEKYFAFPELRGDGDSVLCECRPELRTEGLYLRLRTDRPLASVPSVRRAGGPIGDSLRVFPVGLLEYIAFAPLVMLASGVNLFSIRGMDFRGFMLDRAHAYQLYVFESGGRASFNASDRFAIRLKAPSIRGRSAVLVREAVNPARASPELVQLTPPFVLDFPLEGFARALLCGFDQSPKAGLFRWSGGRGGWRCVGVPENEGGMVEVKSPGVYAVFIDTKAPELKALSFTRANPGSGFFKRKLYYISVREGGAVVDSESAVAVLNGARVVCEWDEYRKRLAIPIPRAYPRGSARLRIELGDLAGNRTVGEYAFVIE
jgi:hypothetical protein